MKIIKHTALCLLVGTVGLVLGCGGSGSSSTGNTGGTTPTAVTVETTNSASASTGFAFASPMTVKSGGSVTWHNQSSAPHNIIWDSHTPSSSPAPGANIGDYSTGATSAAWTAPTVTVNTTYNYHCGIHGPSMAGQIIVTP